jgi:hypothetical protein
MPKAYFELIQMTNDIFYRTCHKVKQKKLKIKNINIIVDSKFEKPQYLFLTYKMKKMVSDDTNL